MFVERLIEKVMEKMVVEDGYLYIAKMTNPHCLVRDVTLIYLNSTIVFFYNYLSTIES